MNEFDDTSDLTGDECRQLLRVVAHERDALQAEVERLQSAASSAANAVNRFSAEADALRAEVERLRADAERYRWLRREADGPHVPLAQVLWKFNNIRDNFRWTNLSDGQTLDEHIDAARGES